MQPIRLFHACIVACTVRPHVDGHFYVPNLRVVIFFCWLRLDRSMDSRRKYSADSIFVAADMNYKLQSNSIRKLQTLVTGTAIITNIESDFKATQQEKRKHTKCVLTKSNADFMEKSFKLLIKCKAI